MNKFMTLMIMAALMVGGCKGKQEKTTNESGEEMSAIEDGQQTEQDEWTVLFDGTSFDGWHVYPNKEVPAAWQLEDGAMILRPDDVREDGNRFNLVTDKEYTDFVLSLEWMVTEGANSGIMWGVV
ncbi:MAG: DUF1080 domain-containing protein, partial [Arenibacter sp.]|nr:DUF1080 domain-containing protein [Arenibacter sp.]